MKSKLFLIGLIAATGLFLLGCNYDVALTPRPTQKIDPRLLGDWVAVDQDAKEEELMHVRQWDDSSYAVGIEKDIYRVYHSDFAGVAFVTAQDLNSSGRNYCYYRWSLSADGNLLTLHAVSTKVVPDHTKGRAAIQKLIKSHLANPALFEDELRFTRKNSM